LTAAANIPDTTGRFAPSPSGDLHFGSLISALVSFLEVRCIGGRWLVRMEDVDVSREVPGAADAILRSLEAHALTWDGAVLYQQDRTEAYQDALDELRKLGAVYPCECSRREIRALAARGPSGPIYPGTCSRKNLTEQPNAAIRVRCDSQTVAFEDRLLGPQTQDLATEVGDFVIRRSDSIHAYQLAVVVDDASQGVTQIVRGTDILESTGRQLHLQQLLGYPTPSYLHHPLAVNGTGIKLSKRTHARPLDPRQAGRSIWQALELLGQYPPRELIAAPSCEVVAWGQTHWDSARLPAQRTVAVAESELTQAGAKDFGALANRLEQERHEVVSAADKDS